MPSTKLVSPDGRRVITVTSKDEHDALKDEGYVTEAVHAKRSEPAEPADDKAKTQADKAASVKATNTQS